jgi:hypothetical protein
MFRKANPYKQKKDEYLPEGGRRAEWGVATSGYGVSFGVDKNVHNYVVNMMLAQPSEFIRNH